MDRNHTKPFSKRGPRAARIAERMAHELVEVECEKYVRARMKPELLAAARQAVRCFKKESWR